MTLSSRLRVLIVEDQAAIRKDIRILVEEQPGFVVIGFCGTVKDATVLIPSTKPDLVLLDINLPDGTGFDILERTRTLSFNVIFLTAYEQHAIKAIKFGALDYLLKPVDENELKAALSKVAKSAPLLTEQLSIAREQYRNPNVSGRLLLHSQDYVEIVEVDEIMYCHSHEGYTTFNMQDGRSILTSKYLKEFEDILPSHRFIRVHQSYLVNIAFIERYHKKDDGFLTLKNGAEIPVATRRREIVNAYLNGIL